MKNMFESEKCFTAFAEIDFCYYMIEEVYKQYSIPRMGIVAAIDKATGYNEYRYSEAINSTIGLLKIIIKNKKTIDADYKKDSLLLSELTRLNRKKMRQKSPIELPKDERSVATEGDSSNEAGNQNS